MKHSLTNKDKAALTADCSVCGPAVPIKLNGRYGIVCVEARRQARRNYKKAHPERARAQKAASTPSLHRLTLRNGDPDTCAICGPVQPKPWGRGYMCPKLHEEKRWPEQSAPDPQCPICKRYLDKYGACLRCDDDLSDLDARYMPVEARGMRKLMAQLENIPVGLTIATAETQLPSTPEVAVHGWKTLGDGPKVSADDWMRQNGHRW
ncbi:hypothetical protein UB45_07740 [Terrabacter sp. 28]|nr:hypothetical protein UB45_07740 [Terrabacter sp. 28]